MTPMTAPGLPRSMNWRSAMWAAITLLLLVPLIAMQFTHEVNWTGFDFAVAALLLGGGGAIVELSTRYLGDRRRRVTIVVAAFAAIALIWLHGAVGIF